MVSTEQSRDDSDRIQHESENASTSESRLNYQGTKLMEFGKMFQEMASKEA